MTNQSSNEIFSLEHVSQLDMRLETRLLDGINQYAYQEKNMQPMQLFGISLKNRQGKEFGGLTGVICYGCMHIDMLWIDNLARGQGWGKKIIEEAEWHARKRGCSFSTLETMDWEALSFYKKLGYTIEFVRSGYDSHSTMYLLRKEYLTYGVA